MINLLAFLSFYLAWPAFASPCHLTKKMLKRGGLLNYDYLPTREVVHSFSQGLDEVDLKLFKQIISSELIRYIKANFPNIHLKYRKVGDIRPAPGEYFYYLPDGKRVLVWTPADPQEQSNELNLFILEVWSPVYNPPN